MAEIIGPDGQTIAGSRSKGGTFAAFNWEQLVLGPPGQGIRRKAADPKRRRLLGFPAADQTALSSTLGHYSDVQSLNSEDTVTASVFENARAAPFTTELLRGAFGDEHLRPREWIATLWQRLPHPKTGATRSGPEADVVLDGGAGDGAWRYVVEAKWTSDIGDRQQGAAGLVTQMEMRAFGAAKGSDGSDIDRARRGVLVIVPSPDRYRCDSHPVFTRYFVRDGSGYLPLPAADAVQARAVTWETISTLARQAGDAELARYLDWRLSFLSTRASRSTVLPLRQRRQGVQPPR